MRRLLALGLLGALAVACAASEDDTEGGTAAAAITTPKRDWAKHPAIVEVDEADEIFALSDPHGNYAQYGRLLQAGGLISGFTGDVKDLSKVTWTGGTAYLVVCGDLIDKGPDSLAVIDLSRTLQRVAPPGHVIVTMGNHEAEFLEDPRNDKALATTDDGVGITKQLDDLGIAPESLAEGRDREGRGAWLLSLPLGARIKKWFFAHAGNTNKDTIAELSKKIRDGIDKNGYGDDDVTGGDSVLEAQEWYGKDFEKAEENAKRLGVEHIAFGHDPGALKDRGRILEKKKGLLVKLNVNMGMAHETSSNVPGQLLHVFTKGTDRAEVIEATGAKNPLF